MSRQRRLFLDSSTGERRGVVTLNGKPERLLVERDDAPNRLQPGAVLAARLVRIEKGLGIAFLQSPDGQDMVASRAALPDGASEGGVVAVQVLSPARRGKAANAKVLSHDSGPPRWIGEAPDLRTRLQAFAPDVAIDTGRDARDAADEAVGEVFQIEFPLAGGGRLTMETTRALIAVDVDVGAAAGQDAKFSATKTNQTALMEAARLARLKGLGGLMVVDLAGKGHNGPVLLETVKQAFAPDQPGVAIGAISRFGVLEIALPWRTQPLVERLAGPDGRLSPMSEALALMRAIEREAGPGRRVEVICSPAVAAAAAGLVDGLAAKIGQRFVITPQPGLGDADWKAAAR